MAAMTSPCDDPASDIITAFQTALSAAYNPASGCPPDGVTATPPVRCFAGEVAPLAAWDAHTNGEGCDVPFLWVRLASRFRSKEFPSPATGAIDCDVPTVVEVEIGVAWCAVIDSPATWDEYAAEAEASLIHSWRLDKARCAAMGILRNGSRKVAVDVIAPYGPEGGILAWQTSTYVSF